MGTNHAFTLYAKINGSEYTGESTDGITETIIYHIGDILELYGTTYDARYKVTATLQSNNTTVTLASDIPGSYTSDFNFAWYQVPLNDQYSNISITQTAYITGGGGSN